MDNRTIEQVRANEDRLIDKNIRLEQKIEELKNINDKISSALNSAESKLDLYKSIIDEIRDLIKTDKSNLQFHKVHRYYLHPEQQELMDNKVLEILDKANIESRKQEKIEI